MKVKEDDEDFNTLTGEKDRDFEKSGGDENKFGIERHVMHKY